MIKKICLISLVFVLAPQYAKADETRVTVKEEFSFYKRYACYPFTINFGGFICRTKYCGNSKTPSSIKGKACGIKVNCRRLYGKSYSCKY